MRWLSRGSDVGTIPGSLLQYHFYLLLFCLLIVAAFFGWECSNSATYHGHISIKLEGLVWTKSSTAFSITPKSGLYQQTTEKRRILSLPQDTAPKSVKALLLPALKCCKIHPQEASQADAVFIIFLLPQSRGYPEAAGFPFQHLPCNWPTPHNIFYEFYLGRFSEKKSRLQEAVLFS